MPVLRCFINMGQARRQTRELHYAQLPISHHLARVEADLGPASVDAGREFWLGDHSTIAASGPPRSDDLPGVALATYRADGVVAPRHVTSGGGSMPRSVADRRRPIATEKPELKV